MTATEMKHISQVRGFDREQPRRTTDPDAGGLMTKHGWLSWEDIAEVDGKLAQDANGNRVVRFPVAYERLGNGELRPIYREIPEHVLAQGERQ